jgi:hypothetical protein
MANKERKKMMEKKICVWMEREFKKPTMVF